MDLPSQTTPNSEVQDSTPQSAPETNTEKAGDQESHGSVPGAFIGDDTKSKITSAASKTGVASLTVTKNSPETSLQPLSSSGHSIGTSFESRPYTSWFLR
jgi:hypothetical protein